MKEHYCPVEKTVISYEGECNWCGEKEDKPQTKPLSDEEIKAIENSVKYSELALSNDEYMLKFARAIEERHGIYVQKT